MDKVLLEEARVLVYRNVYEGDIVAAEIEDLLDRVLESDDVDTQLAFVNIMEAGTDELLSRKE